MRENRSGGLSAAASSTIEFRMVSQRFCPLAMFLICSYPLGMANGNPSALEWQYAVEIPSDFKELTVLEQDVREWLEQCGQTSHAVEVAQPATLIVRFQSFELVQVFTSTFGGRLLTSNVKRPEA
jgi:hypothetical protein